MLTERNKNLQSQMEAIDDEAMAYHHCVQALELLKRSSSGGGYSAKAYDTAAITRILDTLKARFLPTETIKQDTYDPYWEEQFSNVAQEHVDFRDQMIDKLISAIAR
jgi:hypothetical protein